MSLPIELHTRDGLDLTGSLVIVGAPGLGFVGALSTRYLVESLGMQRIGGLHSPHFPPYTAVEKGRPLHPVRLHHLETSCGLGLECEQVVVVTSEMMPIPQLFHPIAETIVQWARDVKAAMVVVPDAFVTEEESEREAIRGIASTDKAFRFLEEADVQPLSEGMLIGLSSTLLSVSEHEGVDTVALLTGADVEHPDARAASRVVGVLDKLLPGIRLETKPLFDQAERIEAQVRELRAQMAAQAKQGGQQQQGAAALSMFH